MSDKGRVVHITGGLISSLLNQRDFMQTFPEFTGVRAAAARPLKRGCAKCQKNKKALETVHGFLNVLRSLQGPKLAAFKKRVQADTITFNLRQRAGKQMRVITLEL